MPYYQAEFLSHKIFGQPYMPTDLTQAAFLAEIYVRHAYIVLQQYVSDRLAALTTFDSQWPYVAAIFIRDIVSTWVFVAFLKQVASVLWTYGVIGIVRAGISYVHQRFWRIVMALPPARGKVERELAATVKTIEREVIRNDASLRQFATLPEQGLARADVEDEMDRAQQVLSHSEWEAGRVSGAVYHGGQELLALQSAAYEKYSVANQLHPDVFPAVRKMEAEVVAMVLELFHAPESGCGTTTSGGTESLLLTGLAAREWGRRHKNISKPEVIAPVTVHAGIEKACSYFGMRLHKVPLDSQTYKVDIKQVSRLINSNTVLLVGSAPNYPHGIIDDIEALSRLAVRHKIPLHVDACLGSFIVSFLERSGVHGDRKLPLFDFRLPGVTSISCDTHKYGFAPKGSSIIMYRTPELRECQYYVSSDWTGGMYGSPTLAGSRPGALMAGCWATLVHIGTNGYRDSCHAIVSATMKLRRAIETEPLLSQHLEVLGDPIASVLAFKTCATSRLNIYAIGDAMVKKGWHLSTLQNPAALHFALTRLTVPVVDELISDLVETVAAQKDSTDIPHGDTAALYGVAGSVATAGVADRIIVAFLNTLYKL
ncbi:putative sphingosine-1-phosphate lyase [Clavispora lusitaniae]|uniref:Sphingosine-1-phosphate lyase n=1 Tax=Clavispora lusitaniae TaxID=36911 RepID=A0ACD0WI43_CLALS|nr:putative sphingosine-1-phosphate lyase [Clavispora lusitaniae]QFZ33523.1 putative sphingosine-1-phosphate lyase [Clavispora lusitaniae]QFZ39194.1 putative sphingosine-1-phosphate lyase [Clavispora lusitaniae]QFZ44876.1 putative sphingosine-1-phosphate lyase [Clavispora lusitaniae]QFZ50553.1 putative sphingosine-1-phosphate lyase [Clavispora lusitaniae]